MVNVRERQEDQGNRDDWSSYRRQVMDSLDRLGSEIDESSDELKGLIREVKNELHAAVSVLEGRVTKMDKATSVDLATLKAKASIWGAICGTILSAAISILMHAVWK